MVTFGTLSCRLNDNRRASGIEVPLVGTSEVSVVECSLGASEASILERSAGTLAWAISYYEDGIVS